MRIGLREANQRFSKAMKVVRSGEEVVLTERGKPIAVIRPLTRPPAGEAALRAMEAAGLLQRRTLPGPHRPFRPMRLKGKPFSHTIREERDLD
jgi:prevent-host-death family protein